MVFMGAFLLWGCGSLKEPAPKIAYYTLEYPVPRPVGGGPATKATLLVKRFSVAPEYRMQKMVYREKAFRRDAYPECRWRAHPGDLVSYCLARDIRAAGLFSAVFPDGSGSEGLYGLEGSVDAFYENDGAEGWEAVLGITVAVLDEREPDVTRRVLLQRQYEEREPCGEKTPEGVAAAMSRAMERVSARVVGDMASALAAKRPAG